MEEGGESLIQVNDEVSLNMDYDFYVAQNKLKWYLKNNDNKL